MGLKEKKLSFRSNYRDTPKCTLRQNLNAARREYIHLLNMFQQHNSYCFAKVAVT